jgi:hypothetical protein
MRFRDLVIRNIASPYGMTVASLLLFLVALLFPPALYTRYLMEPDLIFLDPGSFVLFLGCTLGFLLGLISIDLIFPVHGFSYVKRRIRFSPMWFILLPLVAGTVVTVLSIVLLLRNNTYLLELLLAAQGEKIKTVEGIELEGTLGQASLALMGIVWWAIWRKGQLSLSGWRKFTVHAVLGLAILAMALSSTLKLARGELMPIIEGIAVLLLLLRLIQGKLTSASIFRFAAVFTGLMAVVFASFSMLRGVVDADTMIGDLMGYTIAAYNRLAAILDGRLRYPFSGRGLYVSAFVAFNNTFNRIFHINEMFAWPDFNTVWQSEFGAVTAAGLNGQLIWSGTFGYIFSDLKWLSPLLLFIYGLGTGWAWRSLKLGRIAGIILYPWCAFCILFWFGTNYLLDPKAVVLLLDVIVLGLYERLFVRGPGKVTQE